jgi:hypothetical protein
MARISLHRLLRGCPGCPDLRPVAFSNLLHRLLPNPPGWIFRKGFLFGFILHRGGKLASGLIERINSSSSLPKTVSFSRSSAASACRISMCSCKSFRLLVGGFNQARHFIVDALGCRFREIPMLCDVAGPETPVPRPWHRKAVPTLRSSPTANHLLGQSGRHLDVVTGSRAQPFENPTLRQRARQRRSTVRFQVDPCI